MATKKYAYGWKRGPVRPKPFRFVPVKMALMPNSVDLEPECPAVYNQLSLGSCTAHAAAGLAQFTMKKLGLPDFVPARLALYWWNRFQDGTVTEDAGSTLHDAMNTLVLYGAPHESLWPYDDQGHQYQIKPSKPVWSDGFWHAIIQGLAVEQTLEDMKACLAQGLPFIFGFTVFESFESEKVANTGIMTMPQPDDQVVGGHAVMAVGYNDATQMIKVRNSWGANWGANGYFFMPFNYITDKSLASDFWTAEQFVRFGK